MLTQTDSMPVYVFEDGSPIRNEKGNPLSERDFARLKRFLVADRADTLFGDEVAQRWNARG